MKYKRGDTVDSYNDVVLGDLNVMCVCFEQSVSELDHYISGILEAILLNVMYGNKDKE